MPTYRELFRAPEFTPFFLASSVQVAAQTMSSLALGTLIYSATGSPLLSALAIFGPSLTQVIGASTVLSASDRLPPRAVMTGLSLVFAAGTAALSGRDLPPDEALAAMASGVLIVLIFVLSALPAQDSAERRGTAAREDSDGR